MIGATTPQKIAKRCIINFVPATQKLAILYRLCAIGFWTIKIYV